METSPKQTDRREQEITKFKWMLWHAISDWHTFVTCNDVCTCLYQVLMKFDLIGCWIMYKVSDNQKNELVSYELMSANDAPERDPMDWYDTFNCIFFIICTLNLVFGTMHSAQ